MSDWLLYHVWRIRGYKVTHCQRIESERVIVTITATRQHLPPDILPELHIGSHSWASLRF